MQLQYTRIDNLPPLAWYADIKGEKVHILHGSAVECWENFFVEGAWSGNFADANFVDTEWFCGTGMINNEKNVTFSTPSHVTYGIFSLKKLGGGTV